MSRILLVEDDHRLRRVLTLTLEAHGYLVTAAEEGGAALEAAAADHPDLVLLDLGLPDVDGAEVIRRLRVWSDAPVLVLSARHAQAEKVRALDVGADDYVTKPFGTDELLARVRAALRRGQPATGSPVVATAAFTVDLAAKRVRAGDGTDVRLTPTEWSVLELLARRPGSLVTQRELLEQVWGPQYVDETHYLRVYVGQLRRKLEPDPSRPRHLVTEPGQGYRLLLDGPPSPSRH
jgi:two-component system KDP operon response regulator KdpE